MIEPTIPKAFSEIVTELHALCQQKRSGRLVILPDTKRCASIDLHDGRIVGIHYANLIESDAVDQLPALEKLSKLRAGCAMFVKLPDAVPPTDELPPNEVILDTLGLKQGIDVETKKKLPAFF